MYIGGDLATVDPIRRVDFLGNGEALGEDHILVNLEGGLVKERKISCLANKRIVFNSEDVIINSVFNDRLVLALANNHLFDDEKLAKSTLKTLADKKVLATGAWTPEVDFTQPARILENGVSISIINAGWDVAGCLSEDNGGVAQLDDVLLINKVNDERKICDRVVVYLHWGYELEIYPHPADRDLAKKLIDAGADLIVGCHAHCKLGVEVYKGKSIFYGLGNFAFKEKYYMGGKICFPSFCKFGLLVRYDPVKNIAESLFIRYCEDDNSVIKVRDPELLLELKDLSKPFSENDGYVAFFKKNRRKKNMLPVFYSHSRSIENYSKKLFLKVRGHAINALFSAGLKGGPK